MKNGCESRPGGYVQFRLVHIFLKVSQVLQFTSFHLFLLMLIYLPRIGFSLPMHNANAIYPGLYKDGRLP